MMQIENLSVSYGETLILRGVSLEVQAGQVVCLMGRNGVGKTTLLKSIMGLLRPRPRRHRLRAAGTRNLSASVGVGEPASRHARQPEQAAGGAAGGFRIFPGAE